MSKAERLNVVFVNEYFPPHAPGGAEWSMRRWAQVLVSEGHRVTVVTLNLGGSTREQVDGIDVYRVPFPYKMPPGQRTVPGWLTGGLLYVLHLGWFVWRVARQTNADILHAQSKGVMLSAWLAGRFLRIPVFLTVRDLGMLCPIGVCLLQGRSVPADCGYRRLVTIDAAFYQRTYLRHQHILSRLKLTGHLTWNWWITRLRQWAMNQLDGVIFVSRGLLNVYPARALWNRHKAQVVHNLPDPVEPPPKAPEQVRADWGLDGRQVVLVAGKLSPGKGTPVLLGAARRVAETDPDVVFLLVGKGQVRTEVPPNVRVLGSLPHQSLWLLYHAADVVVVPSVWPEPLSRVILESMSVGKPVIGTDVGGTPELIKHGVNGLLVPVDDVERLAEAISELLGQPEVRQKMGEAARSSVENVFSAPRLVQHMVQLYQHRTE